MLDGRQKFVFASEGATIGTAALVLWATWTWAPDPSIGTDPGARLAFAARWMAPCGLAMVLGIALIMKRRMFTEAIDPISGQDSDPQRMKTYQQYLQNTLEQLVLYVVAHLGFAALAEPRWLVLEPAFAGLFIVGRVLFLLGYLRNPVARAPGFGLTYYPTLCLLLFDLWLLATS